MGNINYYYNGKRISKKKELPKGAKHIQTEKIHNEYFGDDNYIKEQNKNAQDFFARMRQSREDLDAYHG